MSDLFGVIGVFSNPDTFKSAAKRLRELEYSRLETYTPYPVEGLLEIVHPEPQRLLPFLIFVGAVVGAAWGYWIQFWDEALNYPINVGGRPHNSWPAFAVSAFEFMVLFAVAAGLFGLLIASRLPQLYHPLFDAKGFERASRDRFILCIEAADPRFDAQEVGRLLEQLGAEQVEAVRG